MITAQDIRELGFLSATELEEVLRKDYIEDRVLSANFLGISNGGQFGYMCRLPDEEGSPRHAKIWVWRNSNGQLQADY
jgi:hypothetical protein